MADTTRIVNNNIVNIDSSYNNAPVNAGLAGVCVITQGNSTNLQTYYTANDVANDFGNGSYVTNFASNYFANNNPMFQVITYQAGDDDNNAVEALRKYYDCGSEYFSFLATDDKKQTAIDLANLVESQGDATLFLSIPTQQGQAKDFSGFGALSNNKTTILLSNDIQDNNVANFQFVSEVLSVRAGQAPNANLESIHDLAQTQPQDKFNFTADDLKQYSQYHVITYAYRNNIPMLTGGYSASGYQLSTTITRDYLHKNIKEAVANVIVNNSPTYDKAGIDLITDQVKAILQSAKDNDYIQDYQVTEPNATQITVAKKASGELDGLGYSWTPTNDITNANIQEKIELPQL